jgi:hypothetical protein
MLHDVSSVLRLSEPLVLFLKMRRDHRSVDAIVLIASGVLPEILQISASTEMK